MRFMNCILFLVNNHQTTCLVNNCKNLRKDTYMTNWIKNFINDERGAESTEVAVSVLVIAGGAIQAAKTLRDKIQEKNSDMIEEFDTTSTGGTP